MLISSSTIVEASSSDPMNSTDIPSYVIPDVLADVQVLIGIIFTISPIALCLHLSIIYIIFFSRKRNKYKNPFYRLIVVISCTDIYWCNYQMYQGLCNLIGRCPGGEVLNTYISTAAQFAIFVCMNLDLLIAFNRFTAVVLLEKYDRFFTSTKVLVYLGLFLVGSALECIPTWIYKKKYIQMFTFVNMPSEQMLKSLMWFELGCTYVAHSILAVLYIWSFVSYRKRISSTVTLTAAQKKEGRLLIQAVFSGIPCFVMMTFHHLIPLPLVELLGGDWCTLNGPLVYLWFNTEIRNDWLEFIGLRKAVPTVYQNTFMQNMVGPMSNLHQDMKTEAGVGLEENSSKSDGNVNQVV